MKTRYDWFNNLDQEKQTEMALNFFNANRAKMYNFRIGINLLSLVLSIAAMVISLTIKKHQTAKKTASTKRSGFSINSLTDKA